MLKIFSLLITAILIANMFAFPTFTTYGENDDSYLWEFNTIGDLEGWILCNPAQTKQTDSGTLYYDYQGTWSQSFLKRDFLIYSNPTISSLGQTLDKLLGTSQYEKALEALGFSF